MINVTMISIYRDHCHIDHCWNLYASQEFGVPAAPAYPRKTSGALAGWPLG